MRRILAVIAGLLWCVVPVAHAQVQAGVHYAALAQEYPDETRSGVGGFLVWAPAESWGIDVAATGFLREEASGAAWQLLAGPRAGVRWSDLGIYGRVRPGLLRFSRRFFKPNIPCVLIFPPPKSCLAEPATFALDIGGTVEAPLGASTVLRLDLGDTLLRFARDPFEPAWTHNLQFAAGIGWQFPRP